MKKGLILAANYYQIVYEKTNFNALVVSIYF
jgi:hypothetical protein